MEQLMRSAQAGRIVHALLFSGPRGTGKKTMAEIFAGEFGDKFMQDVLYGDRQVGIGEFKLRGLLGE